MKIGSLTANPGTVLKDTELGDLKLLVTGMKTVAFRRRMDVLTSRPAVAKMIKAGGEKEAQARDAAFNQALATEVLKGWENLTDDDGVTPVEFSVETAHSMINDSIAFRDAVVTAAQEVDQDRFIAEEDASGN